MAIEIYENNILKCTFPRVLSASITDKLSGERTLSFGVLASRSESLSTGMVAELDGQYYNIVRVKKQITNGFPVTTAECEHISYLLNDERYNLVTFVFEGTPMEGLNQLLSDTPFSVGICEATERVECYFTEGTLNRRNALMRFIDACGCEIEYDGYAVNLRKHRGSLSRKVLMDGENVTDLTVTVDSRENTASYSISLFKMADLQAGDEVNITYTPMGINTDTRIVGITYDPFYRYTVDIEVGDFVPDILASTATQLDRVKQEFRAADGELRSSIETVEGDMSELSQTVSGFDLRISNAEGAVAALSLTVDGYSTRIENVEGGLADMSLTLNGFNTRIENTEGSISTLSQSLTSITTRVENAEGDISTVSQTADKVNWLIKSGTSSSDFTLTDRAVSLVAEKIDLTGYVTISSLRTEGSTVINGSNITTGTISADRIDASTLKLSRLYAGSSVNVAITSSGTESLYIGGDGTWNYKYLKIFADTIQFMQFSAGITSMLVMDLGDSSLYPNADGLWDLGSILYGFGTLYIRNVCCRRGDGACGSSTYPFSSGYIKKLSLGEDCYLTADGSSLCVNGEAIGTGNISRLYAGTTSYYAELNSSYELIPSTAAYDFSVGSSQRPWKKAYITELYLNGTKFTPPTADESRIQYSSTIYASLNASKQFIPAASTGYYLGSSSYPWQYAYVTTLYINGTKFDPSSISVDTLSYSSTVTASLNSSKQFLPASSTGYSLGSTTTPWANAYVTNLYVNGTKFEPSSGSDFSGQTVDMGGSSSYYIICNTSRELRPNTTSTYNPFYLGTSTYYWHYAYIGSNTVKLGNSTSSKLGFFSATPVARQTVSSTATVATLISALKKYGLIG